MKHLPIPLLICLHFSLHLSAQQPLNFDFEKQSVEGLTRPWGWTPWQVDPKTRISMDSSVAKTGRYALNFSTETGSSVESSLAYWFSPFELKDKKVRLSGWIKTDKSLGAAKVTVWVISDTGWIKMGETHDFQGVADWKPWSLDCRNTAEAHSWYIVLSSREAGKAWFDDIRIAVDGKEKTNLEVATNFSNSQRSWFQKQVSPVAGVQPHSLGAKADFSDLNAFKKSVGDAQIIALGEATHGTSEFFLLKHRLLQCAVQELGVRVFAIEANQLETEKINRFVCKGEGSAEQSIKAMFRVWNTEEMLALIQWMRAYNLQNPQQMVEFVGFDCQDPSLPMDSIARFMSEWDPSLLRTVSDLQQTYSAAWKAQYYPQAPDSVRAVWKANAEKVLALVESRKPAWLAREGSAADKSRIEWAHQNARVVYQAAEVAWTQSVSGRDSFMSENIRWLQAQRGPNARVVVWAHDSHIARSDHADNRFNYHNGASMGKYLSRQYGDKYRAYGLFTGEGLYSAVISYSNHKVVPVRGMNAPRGSFDEALNRIAKERGVGQLFLNLHPALALKNNTWLTQARPVRFVGYAANDFDFGAVMSVPYQFDGLFFVQMTHASKMLR